ncbi:tRNA nucleotidyltransferase [Novimethylophilus kurashikiensis]|uniref:Multifunctional CCA protein n=1 Tax=Novimethylophilus kurashikiensis TaxID=1825523 RepID=A0A2R5FCM3_9PROT|nr:multifunctional CCA addition/repair protein [Novimethylophilus kurashikiensis]GBG14461.1 tRNA nucleotidyltransferase [Novimethylophilus kurashikiensis]
MKIYLVGGAVRDALMGLPMKDYDYVVVGSSPAEMVAKGYKQVGADFPVFLHPYTGDEYALARTERKTGAGYHGFSVYAAPDVTLEDDLSRRDLTINAMAVDDRDHIIDPFGGQADLAAKVLRHVGPAFAEDPVRILRVARFAARYDGFSVAPETMALMRGMVEAGEVDALVPERVWQELSRGLMEAKPSRMLEVLFECGALHRLLPEVARLHGVPQPLAHHPEGPVHIHNNLVLDYAAKCGASLEVRFACLMHDLGKGVTPSESWPSHPDHEGLGLPLVEAVCDRYKVPSSCRELAMLTCRYHTHVHRALELRPGSLVKLLSNGDAFRRPERFTEFLQACRCDARGRAGKEESAYPQFDLMVQAMTAARSVNAGEVAKNTENKAFIPERIHEARVSAVKASMRQNPLLKEEHLV